MITELTAPAGPAPTLTSTSRDLPTATVRWMDEHGLDVPDGPEDPLHPYDGPIAGIAVSLRDAGNTEISRTAIDDAGGYGFDGLPAGDYTVVLTLPSSEDGRPALPPVHTWTGGSNGYRLAGTLR